MKMSSLIRTDFSLIKGPFQLVEIKEMLFLDKWQFGENRDTVL